MVRAGIKFDGRLLLSMFGKVRVIVVRCRDDIMETYFNFYSHVGLPLACFLKTSIMNILLTSAYRIAFL